MTIRRPVPVLLMVGLDQGGVERDVAKIATCLDRSRFEPHVAAFYPHGMRYEDLRAAGVPVLPLPLTSLLSKSAFSAAAKLRRYLREHQIRIVHSWDASGVFGLPVARLSGVPVLISSQLSYRNILDSRTQMLLRLSDRLADAVLVNCEAIRRYMVDEENVPADRVEICYNGVDATVFFPQPAPLPDPLSAASLVIGAVCALRPEKGLTILQEAFARVLPRNPGMKLVFVGSGNELGALQANSSRLRIAGANVFIPATPQVARWMNAIDIFVLPSYSEAFSNSLLEAMACGCAVVGSHVGGTPELTGFDEERGLLFEKGNAEDLARQIGRLIENPSLRRDLGHQASHFARESLSIATAARRTADMYDKWLARKRVGVQD